MMTIMQSDDASTLYRQLGACIKLRQDMAQGPMSTDPPMADEEKWWRWRSEQEIEEAVRDIAMALTGKEIVFSDTNR